jgi:ubiquinol-cytochrome c reductase iron-sulfur subunit
VKQDGEPAHREELEVGSILTVFPEGVPGSPDGQTVLIRVDPGELRLPPDRAAWAPEGFVAYSKICTHAGCPVGLFRAETHELICPCHQSTFDVLEGARPRSGPAARPLPQLPIQLQPDGTFVALGDYPEPVGPSFWDMSRE